MDNSFSNALISLQTKTFPDQVTDVVEMLTIIDVGIIKAIDAAGRATVVSSKVLGGQPITFSDVEVIGIGNRNGGFICDGTGNACLILIPRSCMSDIRSLDVDWAALAYSKAGVKAIPITNGVGLSVSAGFTADGVFNIAGDGYVIACEKETVSFTRSGVCISVNNEGNISLFRKPEQSGTFILTLDNSGVYTSFVNKNGDSKYIFNMSDDGSLSITHVKPGASSDETLNQITINADGTMSIQMTQDLDIATDGALSLTSKGDLTIGSSDGNVTIDSGSGKKVSINGENLEVS